MKIIENSMGFSLGSDVFIQRYKEFERYINKTAKYTSINGYDFDDIKQELLMVLNGCVSKFDPKKASFSTYFIGSCKNRIARLRKQRKNDFYYLNNDLIDDVVEVLDIVDDNKRKNSVIDVLERLEYGYLVIMNSYLGISKKDLAKEFDVSQTTIANRINEAIEQAKGIMIEQE